MIHVTKSASQELADHLSSKSISRKQGRFLELNIEEKIRQFEVLVERLHRGLPSIRDTTTPTDEMPADRLPQQNGRSSGNRQGPLLEHDEDLIEPIAIVGFSLRFPQSASSAEGFWELLKQKKDAVTSAPVTRFSSEAFYHPTKKDALNVSGANYLSDDEPFAAFDANFFSINPAEAIAMDPAQRLLLETSYHAFENAGIPIEDLKGTNTSVHTGCFSSDYLIMMLRDSDCLPTYGALGSSLSMLANRISWFYDLRGPSVNLDSACSSSAMAIDMSCKALRLAETDLGVVAGSSIIFDPDYSQILTNMQMLSSDGKSLAFDERANGYSRGEGVAVVLLKTLSQALKNNDTIRGLIRATGSNQDGRTPGITQPNSDAQARLIHQTYCNAGLSLQPTRFFESHGTGTPLGDSQEARAIRLAFQWHRDTIDPIFIGATKAAIGHLEGAAGVASLIKTILVLENGEIPGIANLEQVNKKIDQIDSGLVFPRDTIAWPKNSDNIRRASINCFGYGGSNCHLVVDDAYSYLTRRQLSGHHNTRILNLSNSTQVRESNDTNGIGDGLSFARSKLIERPEILVWSAHDPATLKRLIEQWQRYCKDRLEKHGAHASLNDLAYTLSSRRSILPWSSFAVVSTLDEVSTLNLEAMSSMQKPSRPPRLGFIFTGQGAQWYAMGRELFCYPLFATFIQEAEDTLHDFGCSWSVVEELMRSEAESRVDQPEIAQPLTCILQMGVVDLLGAMNITAEAVVGHSMGEIAAAYCCGAISKHSALRLCYFRGLYVSKVQERSSMKGGMLAVGIGPVHLDSYLARVRDVLRDCNIIISCYNSPKNLTLSGAKDQLELLSQFLHADGIFARAVRVSAAYHSLQLSCIVEDCLANFDDLVPGKETRTSMISTVTGQKISHEKLRSPLHWTTNMIQPVEFVEAISTVCKQTDKDLFPKLNGSHKLAVVVDHLIEIGPHAALAMPVREIIETLPRRKDLEYSSALYRKQSASKCLLQLAGKLYSREYPVDLRALSKQSEVGIGPPKALPDGPEYPFDHSRIFWHESQTSRNYRLRAHKHISLLGKRSREWNPLKPQWRCRIRVSEIPWVLDHKIGSQILLPGSAMISVALSAAKQLDSDGSSSAAYVLRNIHFKAPVILSKDVDDVELHLSMHPASPRYSDKPYAWTFTVYSQKLENWTECCTGSIHVETDENPDIHDAMALYWSNELKSWSVSCTQTVAADKLYEFLHNQGYLYGTAFQGITNARYDEHGQKLAIAEIEVPEVLRSSSDFEEYVMHPANLDSVMHTGLIVSTKGASTETPNQIPASIDELRIAAPRSSSRTILTASVKVVSEDKHSTVSDIVALDPQRSTVQVLLKGLTTKTIAENNKLQPSSNVGDQLYRMACVLDVEKLPAGEILEYLRSSLPVSSRHEDHAATANFWQKVRHHLTIGFQNFRSHRLGTKVLQTIPHLNRYMAWINSILDEFSTSVESNTLDLDDLRDEISSQGPIGRLFLEVTDQLPKILQGDINIFNQVLRHSAKQIQSVLSEASYMNEVGQYIRHLAHKNPGMRILEIDAGPGSFVHRLHAALYNDELKFDLYSEYVYTSTSSELLQSRRHQFAASHPKMTFQIIDIDGLLGEQGFKNASFDIILGSNISHASKNLTKVIANVRKLLRPGGKIVLQEFTKPQSIELGSVLGLDASWWTENETGSTDRILSDQQWCDVLTSNDFEEPHLILHDLDDPSFSLSSILCSNARTPASSRTSSALQLIVLNAEQGLELAHSIQSEASSQGLLRPRIASLQELSQSMPDALADPLVFLLDTFEPFLRTMTQRQFEQLKCVLLRASRILWVTGGSHTTCDPALGMIDGFIRVLHIEAPNIAVTTLGLDLESQSKGDHAKHILQIAQGRDFGNLKNQEEYCVIEGQIHVRRIVEASTIETRVSEVTTGVTSTKERTSSARPFLMKRSDQGKIVFELVAEQEPTLGENEVEVEVHSMALERGALEKHGLDEDCVESTSEGSGLILRTGTNVKLRKGERVCFIAPTAYSSNVRVSESQVARIPKDLSFTFAATLPKDSVVAFALITKILRPSAGDTVLIHGGPTQLVRAILENLKAIGAHTFVTSNKDEDSEHLNALEGPLCTRSASPQHFLTALPAGADAVIDIGALDVPYAYVAKFGQCLHLDTSFEDNSQPNRPPPPKRKNIISHSMTYDAILSRYGMKNICLNDVLQARRHLDESFQVSQKYPLGEIQKAFEHLEQRKAAKVVLEFHDDKELDIKKPLDRKPVFDPNATYVVAGAFGSLGQVIVKWMAQENAKNLVLLSRSGPREVKAKSMLDDLEKSGLVLSIVTCDISDYDDLQTALQKCLEDMPPVKGCIQASGILKDIAFANMTFNDWTTATKAKVDGSWNLHALLPQGMDFFIMTSSISGILGQATQINYAASNTFQDALARYRVMNGEKATSLDLGALLTGGMLQGDALERFMQSGFLIPIPDKDVLALLDVHCRGLAPHEKLDYAQVIAGIKSPATCISQGIPLSDALNSPLWSLARVVQEKTAAIELVRQEQDDLQSSLGKANGADEAAVIVVKALKERFAALLLLQPDSIDAEAPFHKLGTDSLVAIEIRNWLLKTFGVDVPVFDLLGDGTISKTALVVAQTWLVDQSDSST